MRDRILQLVVEVVGPDGALRVEVIEHLERSEADRYMRTWSRPRWTRWGRKLTLVWPAEGLTATYRWSDVLNVRVQPYREVCSS